VDLLEQKHRGGRRFELTEVVEQGPRVAVGLAAGHYKLFTFAEDDRVVLLQDCIDRDDALRQLAG
jgi:hypothetical protein